MKQKQKKKLETEPDYQTTHSYKSIVTLLMKQQEMTQTQKMCLHVMKIQAVSHLEVTVFLMGADI